MQNWAVIAVSVVALIVVHSALVVLYTRMVPARRHSRTFLLGLVGSLPGAVAWLAIAPFVAPDLLGLLYLPVAALGGLASFLATLTVRATGAGVLAVSVFGLVWSALVFVPVALISFAGLGPLGIVPVDHGGSLAVNVAAGAAALGVLLVGGSRAPRLRTGPLPQSLGVAAAIALTIGWIGWLAGAELAFDDATPSILLNGFVGALGGIAGWLAIQRIMHQSTTITALAAGLMSGLVSVAAGAPLFTPVSAAAAGVLSGAAACYFTLSRVAATRRQQWFIVGSHLVAGGLGVVLLGMLATDMGFLFTGQIVLIQEQVASVVFVTLYSTAIAIALWFVLKRIPAATE